MLVTNAIAATTDFLALLQDGLWACTDAMVVQTGEEIVAAVQGDGYIRRIDTTRYCGSWSEAVIQATGQLLFPTAAVQPGDAFGEVTYDHGKSAGILESRVPYGPFLEYGTVQMAAGWHVTGSSATVAARTPDLLADAVRGAWSAA